MRFVWAVPGTSYISPRSYTDAVRELYPGRESDRHRDPGPENDKSTNNGAIEGLGDDIVTAVVAEDREPSGPKPWLYVNMVASIDGATALDGVSGGLGGTGDRLVFRGLRASADYILVGGATVRAEQYRPPQTYEAAADFRSGRNQQERPRLAVITGSLDLDIDLPFLRDEPKPIVFHSTSADDSRAQKLADVAELVPIGDNPETGRLSMQAVIDDLAGRGARRILSEGGPSVNGQLVAAGLVDEWNLTLAPVVAGGDSRRAAVGPSTDGPPPGLTLARVWTHENYLFCRWIRPRGPAA